MPMLASAMAAPITGAAFDRQFASGWKLEEKLDGHRVIVIVDDGQVAAYSRPRGSRSPANRRALPDHIIEQLWDLGDGIYDGELVLPGGTASDVVATVNARSLMLALFDVLDIGGLNLRHQRYDFRRAQLLSVLANLHVDQRAITTVESRTPRWADVKAIWKRGGEGAILKRVTSGYFEGRRSPDWLKVKASAAAVLRIIGYESGKSGPYSKLKLREESSGVETTVKTLGHAMLADITANPSGFVGRRVVISYQQRTVTGTFRHGIFDHFAGEDE